MRTWPVNMVRVFLLLLAAISLPVFNTLATVTSVTLTEDELLSSEFNSVAWGPASLSRSNVPGPAVRFDLTGLTTSSTGIKDNYPVNDIGQVIPSHGNGDFSIFESYRLAIRNVSAAGSIWVSLIMNTGFTGASGVPSSDPSNDTFWQGPWTNIAAGERVILSLEFDDAIPYNITDNKSPHTQGGSSWPDGVATAINGWDRTEVSAIGFQVADFGGSDPDVILEVEATVIPEPAMLWLAGLGIILLKAKGTRRSHRVLCSNSSAGENAFSPGRLIARVVRPRRMGCQA